MTEGPEQQSPQDPRDSTAPDGGREVLEGLVIPSRRQPRHATPPQDDPRERFPAARSEPPGGEQPAPGPGSAWSPQSPQPTAPAAPPAQSWSGGAPSGPPPQGPPQQSAPPQQGPSPQGRPYASGTPAGAAPGPQPGQPYGTGAPSAPGGLPQRPVPPPGPPQRPVPAAPQRPAAGPAATGGAPRSSPPAGGTAFRQGPPSGGSGPGGPLGGSGGSGGGTPDWGALAEAQEASGARRRKIMMLTGGIVAVVVIAGAVAAAVVSSGKSSDKAITNPSASTGTGATNSLPPEPSFSSVAPPPPANPLDYLSTAAKDKAPLDPGTLFPGNQFLMNGRVYARTAASTTAQCASGAHGAVAQALAANGCRRLLRATYTNGGVAVTVGVAVFDDTPHADKLKKVAQYLAPLNGGGVNDFCHAVACRMTSNSVGRYAYFAIAGLKNGKTITASDTVALQAANDASNYAFQRIIQRGRDAAAADPSRR